MAISVGEIDPGKPVLIAGPTASGKSALALEIAEAQGGVIVNADALQVFANWRILTARPPDEDLARAPHLLYGHVGSREDYSVGHWLREVAEILSGPERAIIVGGTGLYFSALTEGLVEIPPTPSEIRNAGNAMTREAMLAELDPETRARIDIANPARVQRAWEVLRATGKGLAPWQDETPPALLPLDAAQAFVLEAPRDWLTPRIERRFGLMIAAGALEEARTNLDDWDPALPSSRAIGAAELIAHLRGEMDLDAATRAACIATRQYAKRQRTWFRARMKSWRKIPPDS
ncbi:tRNA (adenosine(37)-N6)-dimethylallyltransferase MiaA [Aliiruegeria sabulilitoris]|uniref:tRNA (adenosine(37)-N6)-dimethylallyltransferase MiaA n=1 Tax=Aliiruegeria sabulilitoris TaxID=1510458 RepID=UPI00082B63D8|nr:tRNA (adenosine(37)-N6)-dimethylallyltransferase MiaA [Aliiruegeria sabulilitoris]NDR55073.1 tRNA (adenosine(37)-N6)-dimethylallyltransferase MiaA [Pseudoruegeria sp. M32A2M]